MAIYLDNAATTKPKNEVIEAMLPYITDTWYNPSSLYSPATEVKKKIEEARKTVGNIINAKPNEIFFTSGGSESNCLAIQGFIKNCFFDDKRPVIITSAIEHKSILECTKNVDADVYHLEVNADGFVDIDTLEALLRYQEDSDKILVSIQFANNEIGTVQRVKKIGELAHKYNAIFHTDAVQAFGNIRINVQEMNIDMLSASGHKIGTPKGVGFLYKKEDINIQPIIYGTQMDGLRGGTENVPYIIGMAKAVELSDIGRSDFSKIADMSSKRSYFMNVLKSRFDCKINGSEDYRLSNNISVTFPQNITGEALLYMLDMSDIYVSTSSACNAHSIEPSYVLKAIGLTNEEAMRTIRITLSEDITYKDIETVINEIDKCIKIINT